jgi:hypothetical protein
VRQALRGPETARLTGIGVADPYLSGASREPLARLARTGEEERESDFVLKMQADL